MVYSAKESHKKIHTCMLGWHGVRGFFGLWYEAYVLVYQFVRE